jgi:hypothetical protein
MPLLKTRKRSLQKEFSEKPERWIDRRTQEFRKGVRDSYRERSVGFDRTVMGMFMIGAIATAVGLI